MEVFSFWQSGKVIWQSTVIFIFNLAIKFLKRNNIPYTGFLSIAGWNPEKKIFRVFLL